jgi:hypothetical protein
VDIHFKKHIQPLLAGEKGMGSAAKRKGPNGMAVHAKYMAKQKELHGAIVEKICSTVHEVRGEGEGEGGGGREAGDETRRTAGRRRRASSAFERERAPTTSHLVSSPHRPAHSQALMEGAAAGHGRLTLTCYRPPETIGVPGLPLVRNPDWTSSSTLFCWDPALAAAFQPVSGYPMLYSTRDYLITRLEEYGFKATAAFDTTSGMTYDISGTSGDE